MKRLLTTALIAFAFAACDSKPAAKAPPPAAEKKVEKKAETPPPAKAEAAPADAPAAVDYEEAADTEITGENYQAELDKLAAEIEAE